MASVTDAAAVGDTDHLWDTDFSSADYVIVAAAEGDNDVYPRAADMVAGGTSTQTNNHTNATAADSNENHIAVFGDQ